MRAKSRFLTVATATLLFLAADYALPLSASDSKVDLSWKILKNRWSTTDEASFERFVAAIGEAVDSGQCRSVDTCLKHPANPYRASDPAQIKYHSDCADLPYVLRSYFAWKNHLPFSFESEIKANPSSSGKRDIRYSSEGNAVTKRTDIVASSHGAFPNGIQQITIISNTIQSGMFRHPPLAEDKDRFTDFYPVTLNREGIRPGSVIYDPNGHVAVVFKVEKDGRVKYIDAHPDNSLTRGWYGEKFARSRPGMGAGFKRWRPISLVGSKSDINGNLVGGHVVGTPNEKLSDYSAEQFFGNQPDDSGNWKKGKFIFDGQEVGYYDYLRRALADGKLKYNPVDELKGMLTGLCQDIKDRVESVQLAVGAKIDKKEHPSRLPENIYGTSGEWEDFSTPSRDARLKTSFKEMRDSVQLLYQKHLAGDPSVEYLGKHLAQELLQTYVHESGRCVVSYAKNSGEAVSLTLEEVRSRLFALSFDPYHCVERRWGATDSRELQSCTDSSEKVHWYNAEQRLRNQIERKYDAKMAFSVDGLMEHKGGTGMDQAPDVDTLRYLQSIQ